MDKPEAYYRTVAGSASASVKASGKGWFLVVPSDFAGNASTLTVYDNGGGASGDQLYFMQLTTAGISTPGQPIPLPYTNGCWLTLTGTGFAATIYVWPGETKLFW